MCINSKNSKGCLLAWKRMDGFEKLSFSVKNKKLCYFTGLQFGRLSASTQTNLKKVVV